MQLTIKLDERLSRFAVVKPARFSDLVPVYMTEYIAICVRLRTRHFHLLAAPLPSCRDPATLSRLLSDVRRGGRRGR